jgi:hypothetical protein
MGKFTSNTLQTICVYRSCHLLAMGTIFIPSNGLTLPTASLIPHRRATTPVGVGPRMREPRGDFVPPPLGPRALQLEGVGDELS